VSLLMDALKRAERARQAEAERAKAEGGPADEPRRELSLDPMEETGDAAPEPPEAETSEAGVETEDSLELTPAEVRREIESMIEPALEDSSEDWGAGESQPAPPGSGAGSGGDSLSLSLEYGDVPLDETGSTLPSIRVAQRSVQDYFDGTQSVSMSMEDVREAIDEQRAEAPSADPGDTTLDGDTTSRRRAQAVLDARAVAPKMSARNAALVAVLLLMAGAVASAGFLYKDRIVRLLEGGAPPLIAKAPPPAAAKPRQPAPAPTPAPAAGQGQSAAELAAAERRALLEAAARARAEEQALAEQARAQAAAAAESEQATLDESTEPASDPASTGASGGDGAVAAAAAAEPAARPEPDAASAAAVPLHEVLQQAQASGAMRSGPSSLRIAKRRGPSRTHRALVSAYDAFRRGDDDAAMTGYLRVLEREPRNRDAMLGVAALHMRAGAYEQAAGYYVAVLRRNPRDPAAQAGLIALQEDLDPVAGESRVKILLAENPRDPNLHFSLGNLYAAQERWPEAQQAYFNAYTLDSENPDFAFNLAVSLDRLGQGKPALAYYRRAAEIAAQRPAGFEPGVASRRIAVLETL
jgi:tetratricopeptide (TPR) repeat protein